MMASPLPQAGATWRKRLAGLEFGKLARASAWMSAGTVLGGLLGYVFQVLMGRMLETADFALFGAVMALFAMLSAPMGTLMMVVSRRVSAYRAVDDVGSIRHFHAAITLRALGASVLVLAPCALVIPQAQAYLKAPTAIPVLLLGLMLLVTIPALINDAFLQGQQRFAWLSASGMLRMLGRIVFALLLIWAGFGVAGALGGTILASLAGWIVTYGALRASLAEGRGQPFAAAHLAWRPALPVLAANVSFAVMTQIDMVLVNYFFPPHEAGLYAAASVIGKAVLYLPGGIAAALYPMVAENHARDRGSAHLLLQAVALTAILCAGAAVFYFAFGEWLMGLLYGARYSGAGRVLTYFGFAMVPMALVMVAEYFLVAKGRVLFAYLFAAIAPLQVAAIYWRHETLGEVVAIVGISGLVLAALGYGILARDARRAA